MNIISFIFKNNKILEKIDIVPVTLVANVTTRERTIIRSVLNYL